MNKLIKSFMYIEMKKIIRNLYGILFGIVLFSLVFILISFGIESSLDYGGYSDFLIPGALAFMIAIFSISKGQQIYEEKNKILKEILSFSFNKKNIFVSRVISNSISIIVLTIPSIILFSFYLKQPPNLIIIVLVSILSIFLFQGLGIIISISTDKYIFLTLKSVGVIFLYFFSEIFFSLDGLGKFSIVKFMNPLYYVGDLFRYSYYGVSKIPPMISFLVLISIFFIMVYVSEIVFEKSQEYK